VRKAVETACTYLPLIEAAAALVAELDVLVAFGHVAALAPREYVRPTLLPAGSGVLKIKVMMMMMMMMMIIIIIIIIMIMMMIMIMMIAALTAPEYVRPTLLPAGSGVLKIKVQKQQHI
jgi:hypothetical protein